MWTVLANHSKQHRCQLESVIYEILQTSGLAQARATVQYQYPDYRTSASWSISIDHCAGNPTRMRCCKVKAATFITSIDRCDWVSRCDWSLAKCRGSKEYALLVESAELVTVRDLPGQNGSQNFREDLGLMNMLLLILKVRGRAKFATWLVLYTRCEWCPCFPL